MQKTNKMMHIKSLISILITWLFLLSHTAFSQPLLDKKSIADAKQAERTLDSWSGQPALLDEAEAILKQALARNPENYLAIKELARYEMKNGYINSKDVRYKQNTYNVGNYELGTLDKAEATIRNAIRINQKFAEGYILLSHIQFEQAKLEEAEKTLIYAESLKTKDPWLHVNWAALLVAKGDDVSALKRCQLMLANKTQNTAALVKAYELLSRIYKRQEQHDKVVEVYKKRIQLQPRNAWLRGNYASFLTYELDRNDEAIVEVKAALAIMDYGIGRRILGDALYKKWAEKVFEGDLKAADRYFKEAAENNPNIDVFMAYTAANIKGEKIAKALISLKGVSVNARAEDGSTALLLATNRNDASAVKVLLDLNADPNLAARSGWTPIASAMDEGNLEIADMLLAKGANPWVGVGEFSAEDTTAFNNAVDKNKVIVDILRKKIVLKNRLIEQKRNEIAKKQ